MKRRIAVLLLSAALIGTLIGCGTTAGPAAPAGETADAEESATDEAEALLLPTSDI